MGKILRHIVDDFAKNFKQISDDKTIQKSQLAYWTIMIADRLKSQHIAKRDSGAFLSTFAGIPVEVATDNDTPNLIKNRKHIRLPKCIYDYDLDGGIEYIAYYDPTQDAKGRPLFTRITFSRTTPTDAKSLYYSKYECPDPKNPYFYRVGDYIYLMGIDCVDVKEIEVGLYTTLDPVTEIDLDAPFDFPDELLAVLERQVLDLGRFVLLVPEERRNDGDDGTSKGQGVPTNKLVSVNELSEDTPTNK